MIIFDAFKSVHISIDDVHKSVYNKNVESNKNLIDLKSNYAFCRSVNDAVAQKSINDVLALNI
jgi:hypothetical protein